MRHDPHALWLLFQYGQKHNWSRGNPVREVKLPSDQDAVRMNVLSRAQEEAYFAAIAALRAEKLAAKRSGQVRALEDLRDLHRLMLQQGCRPEELRQLRQGDVDLEHGRFHVHGKSAAADLAEDAGRGTGDVGAPVCGGAGGGVAASRRTATRGSTWGQHQRCMRPLSSAQVNCVPYDFRHTFASRACRWEYW